jgi:hypothetical protein
MLNNRQYKAPSTLDSQQTLACLAGVKYFGESMQDAGFLELVNCCPLLSLAANNTHHGSSPARAEQRGSGLVFVFGSV